MIMKFFKPSIMQRYIMWHIIQSTLMVLLLVLGLYVFLTFIGEVSDIGKGNYGIWQAMSYAVMTIPINLYSLLPMICLLGSMIGLGILASSNELTVARASGMSILNISGVVLQASILIIILGVAIGEGLGPRLAIQAANSKAISQSNGQALKTREGTWLRDHNDFIHIRRMGSNYRLSGVTIYHFNNKQQLQKVTFAKQAVRQGEQWYFLNAVNSYLGDKAVTTSRSQRQAWHFKIEPQLFNTFVVDPQQQSLWNLYRQLRYQQRNGLDSSSYGFTFWQRVFQPLAILVMILLAVPFVFGSMRSASMGVRIVTGIIIGFIFFLLNRFLGPAALIYQIPAIVAAGLPLLLFVLLALVLLRRVR